MGAKRTKSLVLYKPTIYNRWQKRNGSIIHDVTSVKYNCKEDNIFSKIKEKSVKTEIKEHKIALISL